MPELRECPESVSWFRRVARPALAGWLGGLAGAALVVGVTGTLKAILAIVSDQPSWALIVLPLLGLTLSVLVLYGLGVSETARDSRSSHERRAYRWRAFPRGVNRSDLTGEMITYAGREERFPWRLAPLRVLAITATVGLGAPLGTEAPAAYLGISVGAAIGDRGRSRWRQLLRPAAVGGSAAGVAVLMGIPLVGTAYILELGRRHDVPLSVERVTAALVGGLIGWLMNISLKVDLLRLVVPKEPPHSLIQALMTALLIGILAGTVTSITGAAIYRAKQWHAHPALRLALGASALALTAMILAWLTTPSAAIGPGAGTIQWIEENPHTPALTILSVVILRAIATTAAAAAGGCGGLFVPFLAVGDLAGRVFASNLGVPDDLAGAAGAASGISGGYRLPFTAIALALSQGGPLTATLTCLATVIVAGISGAGVGTVLDQTLGKPYLAKRSKAESTRS